MSACSSHVMPQLFGAAISTAVVAVCLVAFDWRLALAALWPIPVAVAVLLSTTHLQQAAATRCATRRASSLPTASRSTWNARREIRATNQVPAFLERVGERVDAFEHAKISGGADRRRERVVGPGAPASSASAPRSLAGALLHCVPGRWTSWCYFCFLLAVTRVYDPVNVILQTIIELLDLRLNIARACRLSRKSLRKRATTEFEPARPRPGLRGRVVLLRRGRAAC